MEMDLRSRIKYLSKEIQKLEQGIFYVERQVLP
jgi:hypothetical protein